MVCFTLRIKLDFGMARLKDKEDSNTTESTIGPIKVWCFQPRHFAYMEYVFTSGWLLNVSRDENIRKRPMHLLTVLVCTMFAFISNLVVVRCTTMGTSEQISK